MCVRLACLSELCEKVPNISASPTPNELAQQVGLLPSKLLRCRRNASYLRSLMNKIVLGVTCVLGVLCFVPSAVTAQPKDGGPKQISVMPTMASCTEQCRKCDKVCETTLAYCRKKGGKHAEVKSISRLEDCIASCKLSADYMSRKSENHMKSCGFCAEICRSCAETCEQFKDDKQMKECAEECRRCLDSCTKMSKMDMSH